MTEQEPQPEPIDYMYEYGRLSHLLYEQNMFLRSEGYAKCDIPACNCGSWHRTDLDAVRKIIDDKYEAMNRLAIAEAEANAARAFLGPFGMILANPRQEDGLIYEDARRRRDRDRNENAFYPVPYTGSVDDVVISERDRYEDALQKTSIALGGDGEWVAKTDSEIPPDSGDLSVDVPVLALEVRRECDRLLGRVLDLEGQLERCNSRSK